MLFSNSPRTPDRHHGDDDPRTKPLLVFDGQCAFCRLWIERWKVLTGDSADYATAADAAPGLPSIPAEEFKKSVILVQPDGSYVTGARAVLSVVRTSAAGRFLIFLYDRLAGFRATAEGLYRMVAGHRDEMHLLTRVLWGRSVVPPGYAVTRWLFLRGMAVIYAVAFASLATQITASLDRTDIARGIVSGRVHAIARSDFVSHARLDRCGRRPPPGLCASRWSRLAFTRWHDPRVSAFLCWLFYFLVVAGQVFLQSMGHPVARGRIPDNIFATVSSAFSPTMEPPRRSGGSSGSSCSD